MFDGWLRWHKLRTLQAEKRRSSKFCEEIIAKAKKEKAPRDEIEDVYRETTTLA
jgi:hypothetical protein